MCYIYFITNEEEGLVKIGFSKNPLGRLKQIETANGGKLKLAKVIKGTRQEEVKYHKVFSRYKVRREWFRLSEEIKYFLEREVKGVSKCSDNELFVAFNKKRKKKEERKKEK